MWKKDAIVENTLGTVAIKQVSMFKNLRATLCHDEKRAEPPVTKVRIYIEYIMHVTPARSDDAKMNLT